MGEDLWKSLGSLISKYLSSNKGITVPKFGTFTYTSSSVSLEGTTNAREKKDAKPVFIVHPEFAAGIRSGINHQTGVRPYSQKGFTGKNPVTILNLSELGQYMKCNKDSAKRLLDQGIRNLSDQAKSGSNIRHGISNIGTFVVQNGIAAVIFNKDSYPQGLEIEEGAANWLKNNLDLDVGRIRPQSAGRPGSYKPPLTQSNTHLRPAAGNTANDSLAENHAKISLMLQARDVHRSGKIGLGDAMSAIIEMSLPGVTNETLLKAIRMSGARDETTLNYQQFCDYIKPSTLGRPQSARSGITRTSMRSDLTVNYGTLATRAFASDVYDKKMKAVEVAQRNGMRPRVKQAPSEILKILKNAGVQGNIHLLHAFMRDNGIRGDFSLLDLINTTKEVLQMNSANASVRSDFSIESSRSSVGVPTDRTVAKISEILASHDLTQLFNKYKNPHGFLTQAGFVKMISELGRGSVPSSQSILAFTKAANAGPNLNEVSFVKAFEPPEQTRGFLVKALQTIRSWLREQKLTSEQGFSKFCFSARSRDQFDVQGFARALKEMGFSMNTNQAAILFNHIDSKNDGIIDLPEWLNKIYEDGGAYQSIKDIMEQNNLNLEGLVKQCNLDNREQLTIQEMSSHLQRLDPSLSAVKAVDIASAFARGRGFIESADFKNKIERSDGVKMSGDWLKQIFKKVAPNLNYKSLKQSFESKDPNGTGKIETHVFQECIYAARLGLDDLEIHRLGSILERDYKVDYYTEFLAHFVGNGGPAADPVQENIKKIKQFLEQNDISAQELLERLGGETVSVEKFTDFLLTKVNKNLSPEHMQVITQRIDINKDGIIDIEDLTTSLNLKSYAGFGSKKPFPTKPLSDENARAVVRAVRNAMVSKRLNYAEAFKQFDDNANGMLSYRELCAGLDTVIQLSQEAKDGLFAVMDKQRIGVIDYPKFVDVLKNTDIQAKKHKDNWGWESSIISQIKTWIQREGLATEDAFRTFDKDFDGIISKNDIRHGLMTVLRLEAKDINDLKIDRLYKLLDTYKRNSIQLADFKSIFEEEVSANWKKSAQQQLGLNLSKAFPTLKKSFDALAEYTGRITYTHFKNWVETNDALLGFNLTDQLLQDLYAEFDPHKKGFLNFQDWKNAFSKFDVKGQGLSEIKDAIRSNFTDINAAYDYFLSMKTGQGRTLCEDEFATACNALIPKRFQAKDLRELWSAVVGGAPYLDFQIFCDKFQTNKFMGSFRQAPSTAAVSQRATRRSFSAKGRPVSANLTVSGMSMSSQASWQDNIIQKIKDIIKASPNSIEEIFKQMDTDNSGKLSAIEFRNAMRKLQLGLTAREIDDLLLRVDTNNDGQIDWQEFCVKFKTSIPQKHIKQRANKKVERFRHLMHGYMLSPKDAFQQFDPDKTGYLNFPSFSKLIQKLCVLAKDPVPSFAVLKDIFNLIDHRKDDIIDMAEWMSVFSSGPVFQESKEFDNISALIARNRKVLLLNLSNPTVPFNDAKTLLENTLNIRNLDDDQWKQVLRVGDVGGGNVDFRKLLEISKGRSLASKMHPRPLSGITRSTGRSFNL